MLKVPLDSHYCELIRVVAVVLWANVLAETFHPVAGNLFSLPTKRRNTSQCNA